MSTPRQRLGLAAITVAVLAAGGASAVGAVTGPSYPWQAPTPPATHTSAVKPKAHGPLVIEITQKPFGHILATPRKLALYTFTAERRDHKVHCLGVCATVWPPLTVARGTKIPGHVARILGTFGVGRRPNGAVQLTWNKLPLYRFAGDSPGHVTGNGLSGFVVARP